MATTYPGTIQTVTNPSGTSLLTSPDHAASHTTINDTMGAVQTKIGVGSGTPILGAIMQGTGNGTSAWTTTPTFVGTTTFNVAVAGSAIASAAEVTTGTEDTKIVTPKALKDAGVTATVKATAAEVAIGTDDTKIVTPKNLRDGLIGVDVWTLANETWTYASATTITVPSGAASKYAKGDKIKLAQTTVKYFYIVGVADTVLTITGGSSYTLTNAVISANYYSHAENPIGFPGQFNFTSTVTGFSNTTTATLLFQIIGKQVFIEADNIDGTSNANTFTFTVPVACANTVSLIGLVGIRDNTTVASAPGHLTATGGSAVISAYKSILSGTWTSSGAKTIWSPRFSYMMN